MKFGSFSSHAFLAVHARALKPLCHCLALSEMGQPSNKFPVAVGLLPLNVRQGRVDLVNHLVKRRLEELVRVSVMYLTTSSVVSPG